MALVPLGNGEANQLFAESVSTILVGISDDAELRTAQAFHAFPMAYLPGSRGTISVETPIDFSNVSVDFTARGTRPELLEVPAPTTREVIVGDNRDVVAIDRRDYVDYLGAIRDANGMTDAVYNKAYDVARQLGNLHRKMLARNLKRLDTTISDISKWATGSADLANPWTNAATLTYSILQAAFAQTKGDSVLMSQDNYFALINSPDLKKRFLDGGESDRVFTRDSLTAALSELAGREVKIYVDSFTGSPEDGTDYLLSDMLLVYRGSVSGFPNGGIIPSDMLEGVVREHAAAAFFARDPGDPLKGDFSGRGFALSNIPGMDDADRARLFGIEYIVNDTQFVAENQVWHQLHSSYGFDIMKSSGGKLFTSGAGRS